MNAKEKFIAEVEALKGTPRGAWYLSLRGAAIAFAEDHGADGQRARNALRLGFENGAQGNSADCGLQPYHGYSEGRLRKGHEFGRDWVKQNPRPSADGPLEITLKHTHGETCYRLEQNDIEIEAFTKRLRRLPVRAFR